jgi:hypothetical protein
MKSYIGFGLLSKKLLFPFILAVISTIEFSLNNISIFENSQFIKVSAMSVGEMAIIIIPHIKIFSDKNVQFKNNEKRPILKVVLHFFILWFIYDLLTIVPRFISQKGTAIIELHKNGLCIFEGIEIIFIFIASFIFLKSKYFIHHIISFIFFFISSIFIDLILQQFDSNHNYIYLLLIFQILFESIFLTYQKYMMDNLYYSPYHVGFAVGLNLFIVNTSLSLILNFRQIKEYFKNTNFGIIILEFLLYAIVMFFFHLLNMFTIAYFTPNHNLITYVLAKMIILLIVNKSDIKFFSIIFFATQIFSLMVYLEIIELKFLGLDKNTKKSIQKRGELDEKLITQITRDSIEGSEDYIVEYIDPKKNDQLKNDNNDNKKENNSQEKDKNLELKDINS